METKVPLKLYQKIGNIMKSGVSVSKNGYNAFQKYKYATESDILDVIKDEFIKNNLVLTSSVKNVTQVTLEITSVTMVFTLVDLDSGEYANFEYVGYGQDKGDKNIYKAYTGCVKYFLSKTFLIGTGDDPENDTKESKSKKEDTPIATKLIKTAESMKLSNGAKVDGEADIWK